MQVEHTVIVCNPLDVRVRIDEAWENSPMVKLNYMCFWTNELFDCDVVSNREDARAFDCHCLRDRILRGDGDDFPVQQDEVSRSIDQAWVPYRVALSPQRGEA
jgi:hypothetical protein